MKGEGSGVCGVVGEVRVWEGRAWDSERKRGREGWREGKRVGWKWKKVE